jgi:APA family basic amino acid/polyamine antiporter
METLKPKIGLRSAIFLVISVIIGSGVFKKIAPMSEALGSPLWVVFCWVFAGLISLAGALSTAELVSMFPNSGGEYHYFQKIYGRFFAFLYGWASFSVIKTAAISALAYIFSQSLFSLFDMSFLGFQDIDMAIKCVAGILILLLTWLNVRGVHLAEGFSSYLTYAMLLGIVLFIGAGFSSPQGNWAHFHLGQGHVADGDLFKVLMLASLGAFWGYEGWNNLGFIGEEIKLAKRNLPLALGIGTLIVMVAYVVLNVVFLYVLPIDFFVGLQQFPNKVAAVEVASALGGPWGMACVAGLILISTLNATNSTILMSARVLYAMARDGLFFKQAQSVHRTYNTPDWALWIQGIWAVGLLFTGSFDQLTDMLVFASFLFYGSSALGVILLRVREPALDRPYRVIGYPWVPLIFVLFCAILFIVTILNQPFEAFLGLSLIATGIPCFFWLNK